MAQNIGKLYRQRLRSDTKGSVEEKSVDFLTATVRRLSVHTAKWSIMKPVEFCTHKSYSIFFYEDKLVVEIYSDVSVKAFHEWIVSCLPCFTLYFVVLSNTKTKRRTRSSCVLRTACQNL